MDKKINLRDFYKDSENIYVIVTDEVYELLNVTFARQEKAQEMRDYRHISLVPFDEEALAREDNHMNIEEMVTKKLDAERLRAGIKQLTLTQQRRLQLYYFEDYTYAEIAALEKVDEKAVWYSVTGALKKLKKILENDIK